MAQRNSMMKQFLLAGLLTTGVLAGGSVSMPQVDLGYEIHEAISFNESIQTYNFSNIRYAQPPVGNLRFAAPVPPTGRNPVVQTGDVGRICPQADPAWLFIAEEFLVDVVLGTTASFNFTEAEDELEAYLLSGAASTPPDPRTSEDCLFLDVVVPKAVYDANQHWSRKRHWGAGAPVVIWIYGGGYTAGSKGGQYDPSGLIRTSQAAGGPGVIVVELNYRLGAMGWIAGPTLQSEGGVSNAGLYDQRLAIEWVSKYIHLFGGDPSKITIMGESAGGGSIEHQITAFGGTKGVSFQRAIPQSPGWLPIASAAEQEVTAKAFLTLLNVSTIAEARQLPSEAIIKANTYQVGTAPYGGFTYGPVVDGIFAPKLPGLLLAEGAFAKGLDIMVGHNADEGALFAPPYVMTNAELATYIKTNYPTVSDAVVSYLINVLYPAVYDGSEPYTSPLERTFLVLAESIFTCNTHYMNKAFNNQTYAYRFEVPPAFHGNDVPYTFYDYSGTNVTAGLFAPLAEAMQGYITNFVKTGNPNGAGLPPFPMQGMNASMNGFNVTGIHIEKDDTVNPRCDWWQQALYS